MILAIDPGCTESAYVLMEEDLKPVEFGKISNQDLLDNCKYWSRRLVGCELAIEMVASYGMAVGVEVFETVFWIGRFWEAFDGFEATRSRIYRKDVKMNLCGQTKAKDSNIRQALIDRFGSKGTKASPGWFYGFKADCWQAYAAGVTYADMRKAREGMK